jgi:hypothetical protein
MKGKKKDSEFLSNFISECIRTGLDTPEEIVRRAKNIISDIDEHIREMEMVRTKRSKLLDVIDAFEVPVKTFRPEEIRVLSFIKIQNPKICQFICTTLKQNPVDHEFLITNSSYTPADIFFSVKQLLEHKVISKTGSVFVRGEMFNDYLQFILGSK